MDFAWDEAQREANRSKHGINVAETRRFDSLGARFVDDVIVAGEARHHAQGFLGDRLIFVAYTMRDDTCRIVSMRRATRREWQACGA
ncbi:MAG: BrnT family toxin [Pseudomonadota bacterium]